MITSAVVDALKRVKGFVDRKVKTDLGELQTPEEGPVSANGSSQANGGAAPAPGANVVLNVEPKPDRIEFEYDEDGNLATATPVYGEGAEETDEE